jgi:flavin-dependent dehydrogenase
MKFDVGIIGGGPAASAAAICLRHAGHSVGVVAAHSQKEKPTETSKPQLRQLLRNIGAESALTCCEPCHGIISDWGLTSPALKPSILDPFGNAWFINRHHFDLHMRKLAKESGATWIEASASDADFEDGSVIIETTAGPVSAKWLVIANGSLQWASRVTNQSIVAQDSLIASWTRLDASLTERCLSTETSDHGWWYMCPDSGGRAVACFITDPESNRELKPFNAGQWNKLFLLTRLSKSLTRFQPAMDVKVLRTGLAALTARHGRSWVSIGDAAVLLDPLGSSGTATAIESAQRVSTAIDAALRGDETQLESYEGWSQGMVREFSRQRLAHYQSECDLRHSAFWQRRTVVRQAKQVCADRVKV